MNIIETIAHLEGLGFMYVEHNAEESTQKALRFKGMDDRGFFLEFQHTPADGYLMDRAQGSKYWDILGKVSV
jgi:hypothetical protein